jgi:hypothetical protein
VSVIGDGAGEKLPRKRSPILVFDLLLTGRVGLEFWLFGSSRVFTKMKKKKKKKKKSKKVSGSQKF